MTFLCQGPWKSHVMAKSCYGGPYRQVSVSNFFLRNKDANGVVSKIACIAYHTLPSTTQVSALIRGSHREVCDEAARTPRGSASQFNSRLMPPRSSKNVSHLRGHTSMS